MTLEGRILAVRNHGGIIFVVLLSGGQKLGLVADRGRTAPEVFQQVQQLKRASFCTLATVSSGADLLIEQVVAHHAHQQGWLLDEEALEIALSHAFLLECTRAELARHRLVEVRPPTLHWGSTPDTSFQMSVHGETVRLASSHALFLDALAMQLGGVCCIQRCFRSEKSRTRIHLNEFDMLEVARVGQGLDGALDLLESLVKGILGRLVSGTQQTPVPTTVAEWLERPFPRIEHRSLPGQDPGKKREKVEVPTLVIRYPRSRSSWTAQPFDSSHACSFNFLVPGVGEVADGCQKANDPERLRLLFQALGLDRQLGWYAQALRVPPCPSFAFGLGMERLAMWLFGLEDIRRLSPFWRDHRFSEIHGLSARPSR